MNLVSQRHGYHILEISHRGARIGNLPIYGKCLCGSVASHRRRGAIALVPKAGERRIRVKSIGNRVGGGVVVGRGVHTDHFPTVGAAQRDLRRRAYRALDGEGGRLVRYSRSRGRGAEIKVGYGDRTSVVSGKSVTVRVDLGGGGTLKK